MRGAWRSCFRTREGRTRSGSARSTARDPAAAGHGRTPAACSGRRRPRDRLLLGREAQAHRRGRRPRRTICESAGAFSGAWSPEVRSLHDRVRRSHRRRSRDGRHAPARHDARPLDGDVAHFHPAFLPTGGIFVFVARNIDPEKTSIVLASLDSKDVRRSSMPTPPQSSPIPAISCSRATTPSLRGDSIPGAWSSPGSRSPRSSRSAT